MTNDVDIVETRLLNAYMLMKLYTKADAFERVVRFLTENTKNNLYIKDLLDKIAHEPNLQNNNIQNYVLFIYQYLGDGLMECKQFEKSSQIYYLI